MDKRWRVAYMDHGPYSELMTLKEAKKEFKKKDAEYVANINGTVIHPDEIYHPFVTFWRKLWSKIQRVS